MKSLADRQRFPRFRVGETIAMTKEAVRMGLLGNAKRPRAAVVAIDGRLSISIRRAGLRSVEAWATSLWRHLRKGERP